MMNGDGTQGGVLETGGYFGLLNGPRLSIWSILSPELSSMAYSRLPDYVSP